MREKPVFIREYDTRVYMTRDRNNLMYILSYRDRYRKIKNSLIIL